MVERWELYIANRHSWVSIKCFCEIPLFWFGLYTVVVGKWTPFFLQNYHLHLPWNFLFYILILIRILHEIQNFWNWQIIVLIKYSLFNLSWSYQNYFVVVECSRFQKIRYRVYTHIGVKFFFPPDMCWNLSNHPFLFYLRLFFLYLFCVWKNNFK